jgi:outer membrane protein assembly factor BamB
MINLTTKLKRNEEQYIASSIGDETVMMNTTDGNFIGLNAVGTEIWNLLTESMSFGTLIKELMNIYEVSENQCIDETLPYLNNMIKEKMIQPINN